jgi:hypothetical protein
VQQPAPHAGRERLEHIPFLYSNANVRIGCVDTGITLFSTGLDAEGYLVGTEFGFNYKRVADQVRMFRERGVAMVFGVYEPGHLRHAMHYVNAGLSTQGSMWDFYLIGDYGLTAMEPIGTNGMKPSLESLYYYLWMIEEAKVKHPWYISIWGRAPWMTPGSSGAPSSWAATSRPDWSCFYDPARNPTNLELLQQAQEIAKDVGRPIATQDEARALYNIT